MTSRQQGFTLLELMIVLSISAILLTVGVPSFQTMIKNNRITTATNAFIAQLNYARSEAIRLNWAVNLERKGSASQVWSNGWNIYRDASDKNLGNTTYEVTTDQLLRERDPFDGVVIRAGIAAANRIAFRPNGTLSQITAITFAVCDDRGKDHGRMITLSRTGRASTAPATSCAP